MGLSMIMAGRYIPLSKCLIENTPVPRVLRNSFYKKATNCFTGSVFE
jgi:hypothetical protein